MDTYPSGKESPEGALERMVQRMANRYGIILPKPTSLKKDHGGARDDSCHICNGIWG
ncbi:hypothetical protein V7S43_010583 [Phytophthora oleae]|uniref:Uncharacterized protein n=1 Tax=Phytophthora oleae TaxID=2107226 RepID=A0ABD3FEX3_9STRA